MQLAFTKQLLALVYWLQVPALELHNAMQNQTVQEWACKACLDQNPKSLAACLLFQTDCRVLECL